MYYELALISVLIAAGYWGCYFVRYHAQVRTYGLMQLGAAFGAGLGLYHRREGGPGWLGVAGAVGVGAGACLLLVGPLVRGVARRFASTERFGIAEKLLALADVLAPGSGVAEERQLLVAMREIRDGKIDQTLEALAAARVHAAPDKRLAIDERTAMLYLTAYRWDEAITYAEQHLFTLPTPTVAGDAPHPPALRRALGIAPPVWVELLGAYGYKGNLDQAARMLARLEDVCAGRDDAAIWMHRGRMVFLALAGRVAAVEQLTAKRTSRHMSPGARAYWLAVAHERKGDARGAALAYAKARSRSRGRPRLLIDQAIEHLQEIKPIELTPLTQELVTRVEAAPAPVVQLRERPAKPWVTWSLTASMFAVAGVMVVAVGDSKDVGVLVRSGAMVRGLIHGSAGHDGEWWRLVSCNFVHVGGLHLMINALGLWVLGKLCEEMFGPVRTLAIFGVAGIGGFVASFYGSPVGISAGASGAIFGVLGAVFAELSLHKNHHRAAWGRGMWGSLAVVAVGQVGIDFMYSGVTDQYAHAGGLACGALMGLLLSPRSRWTAIATPVARILAAVFLGACIWAAVMVVRTPIARSLGTPDHAIAIGPALAIDAPASWKYDEDSLHDPDEMIELRFASSTAAAPFEDFTAHEKARIHKQFDRIDLSTEHVVPLPPGLQGSELAVSGEEADGAGGRQHYRIVIAGKQMEGGVVLVSIELA
ncbi:hypothetical protein BH11MYX1_BH11MYX1_23180 [soil metagenome]